MASAQSVSVSVERLKVGGLPGRGRYECRVCSCAWKAPRTLTGLLASTTQPQFSSRGVHAFWGYDGQEFGGGASFSPVPDREWRIRCSSSFSESSEFSCETLWTNLEPIISYLPPEEINFVRRALEVAYEAHSGQKRRSGEPFIIHPVEVACILGELELDWESIAAGLLHDTVEDTHVVTFDRIEKEFGVTVRRIVEGETKVSKLGKLQCKDSNSTVQDVKADDLRQMLLAMTEEVRVIIVKLADRLHNMRTLSHMPQHKQSAIALETLQVFAPLAKLLGMYQIKAELENLSFMYTNPHDFAKLKKRVEQLYKEHEKDLEEAKRVLMKKVKEDQLLDLMTVTAEIRSVCREPYSVYRAMLKCKGSIHEINHIAQLRIVIRPKTRAGVGPLCKAEQICYHVLGLIHGIWSPVPRSIKDYIATPKPNGYQSLHTTVIPFLYESMFRLEVQIRTEEMDMIAQRGIAAHYSGKGITGPEVTGRNPRGKTVCLKDSDIILRVGWLNAIREWQEEFVGNMSSREFVDTVMRDLLGTRVFVFTPKGEIKNLPKGATVIDFAYLIHTEIGNKMVAAKVNGNLVSPMHVLANAEVVEIITYDALSSRSAFQRHRQWLRHAKTRSARHKIMKFLKEQASKSAAEITAEAVKSFVSDIVDEDSNSGSDDDADLFHDVYDESEEKFMWKKLAVMRRESDEEGYQIAADNERSMDIVPRINGKQSKAVRSVSLKINGRSSIPGVIHTSMGVYKEVLPGLENWKLSKVATWHNLAAHSVQWLCVVCIDRRGMMAEVASALTAAGMTICSCVAEIDRRRGMGVILCHIEGTYEDLADACTGVDFVLGVLGWSAGCSWASPSENRQFFEC
ncbi:RELA/SPOT homolog 1 [Wolffia australiana]